MEKTYETHVSKDFCNERFGTLMSSVESISEKVDKMMSLLNGNGEIGLYGRVMLNEKWIDAQRKSKKELVNWIYKAVITAMVTYLVTESMGIKLF